MLALLDIRFESRWGRTMAGIIFLILGQASLIQALPKKSAVLSMLEAAKTPMPFPFSAQFTTKVFVGNQAIKDSGTLFSQPPDCMQIVTHGANTQHSSCGDTTWTRLANGTVSRSLGGAEMLLGMPGATQSKLQDLSKPDTNAMLILASELEHCVKVVQANKDEKIEMDVDTLKKVILKATVQTQGSPALETGFAYEKFNEKWAPKEIRSSLPGGFFVISYSAYKKEKKRPRKDFRLL